MEKMLISDTRLERGIVLDSYQKDREKKVSFFFEKRRRRSPFPYSMGFRRKVSLGPQNGNKDLFRVVVLGA